MKPKIAICAAFYAGREVVSFIAERYRETPLWVATCAADNSAYEQGIAELCEKKGLKCIRRADYNSQEFISLLRANEVDVVILAWIPVIIKKEAIQAARIGWINMHPSYLPYGRGKHGYYWAIVEGGPFGVTLHFIDEKIDAGKILFQKKLPVEITDTGETLYERSLEESISLFKESYPRIVEGDFGQAAAALERGTFHYGSEIERHSCVELDQQYRASDLINIIRGRTFFGGPSAYFVKDNKKYFVRISIEEAKK